MRDEGGEAFSWLECKQTSRGEGKAFIDLHQVTVKSKPEAFKKIMEIWWNVTLLVHQWIEFHEEGSEISCLDTNADVRGIYQGFVHFQHFFNLSLGKKFHESKNEILR